MGFVNARKVFSGLALVFSIVHFSVFGENFPQGFQQPDQFQQQPQQFQQQPNGGQQQFLPGGGPQYQGGQPGYAGGQGYAQPRQQPNSNLTQIARQEPHIVTASKAAADHLMRHAGEMLYTCNRIRANRFRVSDRLIQEMQSSGGYIASVLSEIILGPNAPVQLLTQNQQQGIPDVGYSVCWWIDELRLKASLTMEGLSLTQMVTPQQNPQLYYALNANVRQMNKAAHEAIAASYFYIEGLHRTCLSVPNQNQLAQNNCPGNRLELQRDLVMLEGKTYAVRTLLDKLRTYENLSPGFPQGNPCTECTFAQYRYNPGIDYDANQQNVHNLVPYPFYAADSSHRSQRHPYAIYESHSAALTAQGIYPSQDNMQSPYNGDVWQQAWNTYDLQYINPNSPVSTPVAGANQDYTQAVPNTQYNNASPYQNSNPPSIQNNQNAQQPNTQQQPQQRLPAQPNLNATPIPWGDSDT